MVPIVGIGVYPKPILDRIEPSVEIILDRIEATTDYEAPEYGRVDEIAIRIDEADAGFHAAAVDGLKPCQSADSSSMWIARTP